MSNQIAQIRENPFLQYFLGLHEYLRKDLFDPSMMVHFRKRIRPETLEKVNLAIILRAGNQDEPPQDPPAPPPDQTPPPDEDPSIAPSDDSKAEPNGKLIIREREMNRR